MSQVAQIQGQFLDALFDDSALSPALAAFAEFCGATNGHLMVADGRRNLLVSRFSGPMDSDLLTREAEYQEINPRVLAIPAMRQGKASRDKDFITRDEIRRDPTYQELILPAGLGHFCAVPAILSEHTTAGIALHRPMDHDPFSDEEAHRHEAAAAACASVFELATRLEYSRAASLLDMLPRKHPAVLVGSGGRILSRNEAFEALVASGEFQPTRTQILTFATREGQKRVLAMLNHPSGAVAGKTVVRGRKSLGRYICTALPTPFLSMSSQRAARAILTFESVDTPRKLDRKLLGETYRLTRAELDIAELLFLGKTTGQIAKLRRVSIHTVRTLLKRIFDKTETSRQAELIRLLSVFSE